MRREPEGGIRKGAGEDEEEGGRKGRRMVRREVEEERNKKDGGREMWEIGSRKRQADRHR